ncbi:MAG: carbohydrate ABC transporter permease [Clostridia bacterium]|nr:carbohydrate ABC transporter permease [Clostridia bacterium]
MVMDNKTKVKKNKIRENTLFNIINVALLVVISFICFMPFLNVVSSALSTAGFDINFVPKGTTGFNFLYVFTDAGFWRALGVSFFVVVVGTALSVMVMFSAAYALSKKDFPCRKGLMVFFIITMIFSGGMVPNYIVVRSLGLTGSPWALILPSVVQVYNLILIRSYLESLPAELEESAGIDGANSLQTMFRILLPVSMPCVASVSLFTAVTFWNNYTSALLYLGTSEKWYPLSLYILNYIQTPPDVLDTSMHVIQKANIESAMIVVSIIPILLVYPFVLKFFTKGVTVGAVKG